MTLKRRDERSGEGDAVTHEHPREPPAKFGAQFLRDLRSITFQSAEGGAVRPVRRTARSVDPIAGGAVRDHGRRSPIGSSVPVAVCLADAPRHGEQRNARANRRHARGLGAEGPPDSVRDGAEFAAPASLAWFKRAMMDQ